jgi:plastocyanin
MRRLLLSVAAAAVLVLGLGAFAVAQNASSPAGMQEEEETPCPEAMGTPSASPGAMETEAGVGTPTAATEGSPSASPGAEEGCHVDIRDFAFSPAAIEIEVGTTVTWENYDTATHTVTADDGSFDSGDLAQGDTFSHTFDKAGTFTYHCNFHPNMIATITVH